jgi:dihydroorotate dehydrogenase
MAIRDRLALSALYRLQPEAAHDASLWALEHGLVGAAAEPDDPLLATRVWNLPFANPIGLAAGFDKNARAVDAILDLGFGFVEAGTVTPRPQPGNPKPRLFRLDADRAVINRLGFNSLGVQAFAERMRRRQARGRRAAGIVGINVGKNRDTADGAADYVLGVEALCAYAGYLVVNISSPNTPGLRALQARAPIQDLLERVLAARQRTARTGTPPPLLAKVGPDLDPQQMRDIAEVALAVGIDGLIIGNTTIDRPAGLKSPQAPEAGGLSGRPLREHATECLREMYRLTGGRLPLIGCGGVASGADAYAKLRAGATLVQVYSALVFEGPRLAVRIRRELAALLRAGGYSSVAEAVGADHRPRPFPEAAAP